ncbi:hypothetical protein MKW94_014018 [Papaver nudicaule]|uniref:Response regulatory domain-containing protein n=1 Tax=Papaver nudicaule TaxID=74823 RepID=A0AA41VCL1_PAPNU|nr:hypothetical protein [Papaver nudicaule]
MEFINNDKFHEGLRVLVVDDSSVCLKILKAILKKCRYEGLNGFELLKINGLEMDIPVIMMSAKGDLDTVMKGVLHGACDHLVKPLQPKEIQNIWKYVIRFKKNKSILKRNLKRRNNNQTRSNEDEVNSHFSDEQLSNNKRTQISWADPELHAKFVEAFYKLGDKVVPLKILAKMNVPGLTREKVASHLQKYRKILEKQSRKSDSITASSGRSGHLQNTFPSLLNHQFQNEMNYLSSFKSYHPGTSQLSHHGVTPIASNHSYVNPQPNFLPSSHQYISQFSSGLGTVNQNHQMIQVHDSTMQNFHNQTYASRLNAQKFSSSSKLFNPHMVSSSYNFPFGEISNTPPNNKLFDDPVYYPMPNYASSGYDEMINMVAPPSTSVMETQKVDNQIPLLENPLAFLEADNIKCQLGSYSSADDDLSAAIRPYQRQ